MLGVGKTSLIRLRLRPHNLSAVELATPLKEDQQNKPLPTGARCCCRPASKKHWVHADSIFNANF